MEFGPTNTIIRDLCDLNFACADKESVLGFLSQLQQWRGMFDAVEINVARRLHELSVTAPADLAAATRRHRRSGEAVFTRSATLAVVGALTEPLRKRRDQRRTRRHRREEHASAFAEVLPSLINDAVAANATPDDLAKKLSDAARGLENDDGISRHQQQRRDTALRTWTDKRNGMFRIAGTFDPLSGALLNGRVNAAPSALFAEKIPSTCPTDPGLKQDHPRALALLALTGGSAGKNQDSEPVDAADDQWSPFTQHGPSRFGRPEIVVVLDARTATLDANKGKPVVDWGIPVELPAQTLEELFKRADAHPVILANGVVLYAPGEMNLGRTTRLASRAQRRALRALYATCAVYGCAVKFDHCQPHHVDYWENGGHTDLANLLPLCSRHHHLVHEGGWKLTLQPDRTLLIAYPDGAIQTTGPPLQRQAA
jgi:hypothetical protein